MGLSTQFNNMFGFLHHGAVLYIEMGKSTQLNRGSKTSGAPYEKMSSKMCRTGNGILLHWGKNSCFSPHFMPKKQENHKTTKSKKFIVYKNVFSESGPERECTPPGVKNLHFIPLR